MQASRKLRSNGGEKRASGRWKGPPTWKPLRISKKGLAWPKDWPTSLHNASCGYGSRLLMPMRCCMLPGRPCQKQLLLSRAPGSLQLGSKILRNEPRPITVYGPEAFCVQTSRPCARWQMLREAQRLSESPEIGVAHRVFGITCWFNGDYVSARVHLEQAVATYDHERDCHLASRFGYDPGVVAMFFLGFVLLPLGEVDRAARLA